LVRPDYDLSDPFSDGLLGKGDGSSLPQLQIVKSKHSLDTTSLYYGFGTYFQAIWDDSESWNFKDYL
jgi:hypothetical protein